MLRLIDKYCIKDYSKELEKHETANKKRLDPEKKWHNLLFGIGLTTEALAIIYYVGFYKSSTADHIDLISKVSSSWPWFRSMPYLLALFALLMHQWYIKNTFMEINEITTHNYKDNNNQDLFPNSLMFSNVEYRIRQTFFLFLAIIAGEIPYILLILEKVINPMIAKKYHVYIDLAPFLTYGFIVACLCISFLVLLWDIIVYRALFKSKVNVHWWNDPSLKTIRLFTVSGFLSFGMWLLIFLYIYTSIIEIMEIIFYFFAGGYFFIIVIYRALIKKNNPLKGDYANQN